MPSIQDAYNWAVRTCNAANVGYSQAYRNQQTVNGITYYDCSSFINYALLAGGFSTPGYAPTANAFTTATMGNVLLSLGFSLVTDGSLKPGDIGVSNNARQQHTEMVYKVSTDGKTALWMGAHTSSYPLDRQVSIGTAWSALWFDNLYRYGGGASGGGGGATPPAGGISAYVVAAIAGNMWIESGINPAIWESLAVGTWTDLLKGYGLGQWTNTGGNTHGRLYQLHTYLSEHGYADDSGDGQCHFIVYENYWTPKTGYSDYKNLNAFLHSTSTDIDELTHYWNYCWEGIKNSTWDERAQHAHECFDYINAHANDASITQWITGNRFLSVDERLNNAVMLFRCLRSILGDGTQTSAFTLTVQNGVATSYTGNEGTRVVITANRPPRGKVFTKWDIDGPGSIDYPDQAHTTFQFGNGSCTIKALYTGDPGFHGDDIILFTVYPFMKNNEIL